jgi:hypothetical protein
LELMSGFLTTLLSFSFHPGWVVTVMVLSPNHFISQ